MSAKNSLALLMLAMASVAGAQWNIDLDIMSGSVGVGNGAPSSAFGGAAGQVGYWNRTHAIPTDPEPIANTLGLNSGASIQVSEGSVGGGWGGYNNPNLSGDFALLMKDAAEVDPLGSTYWFRGISNGIYDVYVYAAAPNGEIRNVPIIVPGSSSPNPQIVRGPLTSNVFALGITHSKHRINVSDGLISVRVGYVFGAEVNGFQIAPVPEPGSLALCISFLGFALERRGSAQNRKMR